jgi:hypothetical protein
MPREASIDTMPQVYLLSILRGGTIFIVAGDLGESPTPGLALDTLFSSSNVEDPTMQSRRSFNLDGPCTTRVTASSWRRCHPPHVAASYANA